MTYETQKPLAGRKPIRKAEIDFVKCALVYGTSPCTANAAKANLVQYSEQFDNAYWAKSPVTITPNDTTAPDGTLTADKATSTWTVSAQTIASQIANVSSDEYVTVSNHVKQGVGQYVAILIYNTTEVLAVEFDLDTNAVHDYTEFGVPNVTFFDAGIEPVAEGFYRIWATAYNPLGLSLSCRPLQILDATSGRFGDTSGMYHWQWGAQYVPATVPGIYYKTEAAAFTGTVGTECYNTRKTCQDPSSFDGSAKLTIKLSEITTEHQFDMAAIPCISKIQSANTQLDIGAASTGRSGGLQLTCVDFPHHDRGIDPYVTQRTYDTSQGTFFGKLKARNPYYQDAELRLETGYFADAYAAANFQTRTYFVDIINGPDSRGQVKIICQDMSRRLDDERATCPMITTGALTATLLVGTTTNFTVTGDTTMYTTGGGAVRINDEIIEYASGVDNLDGTYTFSTLTRGADNTIADEHDLGDGVQLCYDFTNQTARQIAYTLYTTFAGIPAANIDTAQWDAVADIWLQAVYSRRITEPTGVKKLLSECNLQMNFFTWWNDETGKFNLEAIRPPDYATIQTYTQGTALVDGSVSSTDDPKKRVTQVHVYYDARTPIEGTKDSHFKRRYRQIDAGAESTDQYGDSSIKNIYARWLNGDAAAGTLAGRYLNRFRDNIRIIKFDMDAKDEVLSTGDQCYLNADELQSPAGARGDTLVQVIQRDEADTGHRYQYRAWELNYFGRYMKIAPTTVPDYSSASELEKKDYGFISAAGGANYADGGTAHKII